MLGPPKPRRLDAPIAVSLEALVPPDHFYRHLEATLDLGFVRDWARDRYADRGRPGVDPVVFFKLQLVLFFEGIRSERKLIETASLHLAHRWYLGYALDEDLPDHSSFTRIRQRLGIGIFERSFERVVDLCQAAGLVWGKKPYFDATKVQADADVDTLVPRFAYEAKSHVAGLFGDEPTEASLASDPSSAAADLPAGIAPWPVDAAAGTRRHRRVRAVVGGTSPESPCRLFVYLARDAPVGVVLRRGPSDWVRLSRWNTEDDTFEHGQWMRNRVYERRSDLSPDGALFVAFVRGSGRDAGPGRDSWVAISRPPWFTALALWFVGTTYCVGGFFPEARSLWLGFDPTGPDKGELPPWLSATTSTAGYIDRTGDWTERTVWFNRLLRDGWKRDENAAPETWGRPNPDGTLVLEMTILSNLDFGAYGGRYVVEYAVVTADGKDLFPIGRATWADWDRGGRLVVARGGKLLHWRPPGEWGEIADFNPQVPDPTPAPAEAQRWPTPSGP